jgi:FtsZ-binding cell division protein ZapB
MDVALYRARIGAFASILQFRILVRKAKIARERIRGMKMRGAAATLTVATLLMMLLIGGIEPNPGPVDGNGVKTRQQSVSGGGGAGAGGKVQAGVSPGRQPPQPTLLDVMMKLNTMNNNFNTMSDNMNTLLGDVSDIKQRFCAVQEEVAELRREVDELKQENQTLKDHRDALWNKVDGLEKKTDDLECRSRRNNLIFYGLEKRNDETPASCEERLHELFTDTLELSDTVQFDRVHRLGDKPDAPLIARCTFYKDKVTVLKAKSKLKGTNIFVGEDFSQGVRAIRKKLAVIMKEKKGEGKQVTMVYDHLIMDGRKYVLNEDGVSVKEVKAGGK